MKPGEPVERQECVLYFDDSKPSQRLITPRASLRVGCGAPYTDVQLQCSSLTGAFPHVTASLKNNLFPFIDFIDYPDTVTVKTLKHAGWKMERK